MKFSMHRYLIVFFLVFLFNIHLSSKELEPFVLVLGIAQDGGYPHLGCLNNCCDIAWTNSNKGRYVVSLAIVDPIEKKWWLIEATPNIKEQLHDFQKLTNAEYPYMPNGIFISHAHIGHYSGLLQLGKEVFNTNRIPVYVLPKMKKFLETNGPWSQLVNLHNISILELDVNKPIVLSKLFNLRSFTVPHRDEFSETAGFIFNLGQKNYLFIPDIDKWSKWRVDIIDMVKKVEYAFLDATFFSTEELKNRKIEEIPHPLVLETIDLFKNESSLTKSKIKFIHFNHTNPLLWSKSKQKEVLKLGFGIAEQSKTY